MYGFIMQQYIMGQAYIFMYILGASCLDEYGALVIFISFGPPDLTIHLYYILFKVYLSRFNISYP